MRRILFVFALGSVCSLFAAPENPADLLPPAPPWSGASEQLIVPPGHPWMTPAERTGLADTPTYDETLAWLQRLADASPHITLQEFGRTAQGRPLIVVLASREGAASIEALRQNGRPTLLAQAGIHAGEIDGKDAGLMLLRELAFGAKHALLERVNFVLVPAFNADGHERTSLWSRPNQRGPLHQGWRTTAQNLNLNRDYMKADAPEMQAMLRLLQALDPALYLDLHVTDGVDYQYDITYGFHGERATFAWSPRLAAWLDTVWRPAADAALRGAGHQPGPLVFAANNRDLSEGLKRGPADPRFSQAYGDLRHLPTVLVENHSLKPYRQRVLGTCVLLEASLRVLGEQGSALRAAIAADRALRPATLPFNWSGSAPGEAVDFAGIAHEEYLSPASGVQEVRWLGTPEDIRGVKTSDNMPLVHVARPRGYWIPAEKSEVIARLSLHGITVQPAESAVTRTLTFLRLRQAQSSKAPFEGRFTWKTAVVPETRTHTFPAGSVFVSTDQPLGDLAVALLEPQVSDSFFAWGFFQEIMQRTEYVEGYVIAPLAEQMLAESPSLRAEFEAKLAADAAFAADADARLRWFYERTKFYDERHLLYPVGIER